jgi:rhamnose utilization protein RhaD (predicted bifunctional aldolase and dehydrogenase)
MTSYAMHAQISDFCSSIGRNPMLVQAAGGNVSWKDGDTLWIKASGTWLRDAGKQDIFVPVDLQALQAAFATGHFDVQPRLVSAVQLKPSIETILHALMPQKIVVHVHAIEPLSWLVRENALDAIKARMPHSLRYVTVPYSKPGKELAQSVWTALQACHGAQAVLMMNHGVVVAGDSLTDVQATLETLLTALAAPVQIDAAHAAQPPGPSALAPALMPLPTPRVHALATDVHLLNRVTNDWILYPDHVVFLGARAIVFDTLQQAQQSAEADTLPKEMPIFIKNTGVFSCGPVSESKLEQLGCYHDLVTRIPSEAALRHLSPEHIAALLNWDAEKYRQKLEK